MSSTPTLLETAARLFFVCIGCKIGPPAEGPFCDSCTRVLTRAPSLCPTCWLPHPIESGGSCRFSSRRMTNEELPPPLFALLNANPRTLGILKAWKTGDLWGATDRYLFKKMRELAPELEVHIRNVIQPDWIVPVPQPPLRRFELHGGSTLRLARAWSGITGRPWVDLLAPVFEGATRTKQSTLSLRERFESPLEFRIRTSRSRLWLKGHTSPRILLVDDIVTSGRTLITAGQTLQREGYRIAGYLALGWRPANRQ